MGVSTTVMPFIYVLYTLGQTGQVEPGKINTASGAATLKETKEKKWVSLSLQTVGTLLKSTPNTKNSLYEAAQ